MRLGAENALFLRKKYENYGAIFFDFPDFSESFVSDFLDVFCVFFNRSDFLEGSLADNPSKKPCSTDETP